MSTNAMMNIATDNGCERPADQPRLSDKVVIGPPEYIAGSVMHLAKHTETGRYYRMGQKEVFLLQQLNGERTSDEILKRYQDEFGKTVTAHTWQDVLRLFVQRGLIDGAEPVDAVAVVKSCEPAFFMQSGPFSRKLVYWNPDRFVAVIAPYFRWFINGPVFAIWAAIAIAAEVVVFMHFRAIWSDFMSLHASTLVMRALTLLTISIVVATFHEFGHAIACKRYGGEVQEMGFLLRYLSLCCYTRIDDILLLQKRRQRVYVLMIGPLINLSLIPFALYAWLHSPQNAQIHAMASDVLIWYNLVCLVQLVPFLQFDGYFTLAQLLRMPDLRKDSYRYLLNLWKEETYSGSRMQVSPDCARYLIPIYVIYGVLSLAVSSLGVVFIMAHWGRSFIKWFGTLVGIVIVCAFLVFMLWRLYSRVRLLKATDPRASNSM